MTLQRDSTIFVMLRISTDPQISEDFGGPVVALNIPAGQWHTVEVLESGTVIMEVKDGPYEPIQDCDILK